jgi:hypothetical protein
MKWSRVIIIQFFVSFLFLLNNLQSQTGFHPYSGFPLKRDDSPLFGKDIVINDQPTQDQRSVAICSAFNGWLYSAYSYSVESYNHPFFTILRSTDNGITWSTLYDYSVQLENHKCYQLSLISTGDSISNIKIILSGLVKVVNGTSGIGQGFVSRFNGETGAFEQQLFSDLCYDVAISGDLPFPAGSSNPSSIGVLYSKYSTSGDSIIFQSSSNGGMTLDNRKVVALTAKRFNKVALAYGRSLSWNSGRYFAVWEEKNSWTSNTGHIYTAHTEPEFNSSFTVPVRLDSIDPSAYNNAKNPAIACQYNNIDNDSSNLTEIILFDKYLSANNKYDIVGLLNKKAASTNNFTKFILNSSLDNKKQTSINFNPFDSTFMVTYYDSTTQKLPFLRKNFNMLNPDSWQIDTPGYNDDSNLSTPYPKVVLNLYQHQGANVWTGERTGGNGVAMFDAPYNTWTGVLETRSTDGSKLISVYPNPCSNEINIAFDLEKTEKVTIKILSILGQHIRTITNQFYLKGKHVVQHDVSKFLPGTYLYKLNSGDGMTTTGKFLIIR